VNGKKICQSEKQKPKRPAEKKKGNQLGDLREVGEIQPGGLSFSEEWDNQEGAERVLGQDKTKSVSTR